MSIIDPTGATQHRFDETSTWDPSLRDALLDMARLGAWQMQADRLLMAEGAGHLVHDLPVRADGRQAGLESRPWRVDPIPYVIDTASFQWLSAAVVERMEALERIVSDLYGERSLLRQGVVPIDAVHGTHRYRLSMVNAPSPPRWITTYAVDVARLADGSWRVVQDFTDAPPGLGYALLDRSVMSRIASDMLGRGGVASLARFPGLLRQALAAASPVASPRTVLFTGGIDHPSYIDHSYLAVQLGVHLVEGADLVVRQRRVWLRTLDGEEPVDVVYRRLEDPGLDPLEVGASGNVGVPGLLLAVRSGGVALANAHGAGVIEEPGLERWWERANHLLTGSELRLPLMSDRDAELAVSPLHTEWGVTPGSVVLRMFAVHDGRSAAVLPGGSGRVLAQGDDPANPTACAVKDVWVIGRTLAPLVAMPLPQVDFGDSVPTRAAAALYWMNRSAERAESMARLIRVISARLEQDPGVAGLGGGRWVERMQVVARGARRWVGGQSDLPGIDALYDELARTGDAVAFEIGALLTEATTVREYLSVTTGRVLERLARGRSSLQRHVAAVDDLDAILTDLAALVGLWNESTVRGPAWRLGDLSRRLERATVVLDLMETAVTPSPRFPEPDDEQVDALVTEVLLASNESLVAYRRRHRSDVEIGAAAALLLRDSTNPRSLAACVDLIESHANDAGWTEGAAIAARAREALVLDVADLIGAVRPLLEQIGTGAVARWFASPVNPVVIQRNVPT
jgi:uncharacterized circularly permuted ATP-grasp superfamily protein/uncharacterized alpha-E superfamily protein